MPHASYKSNDRVPISASRTLSDIAQWREGQRLREPYRFVPRPTPSFQTQAERGRVMVVCATGSLNAALRTGANNDSDSNSSTTEGDKTHDSNSHGVRRPSRVAPSTAFSGTDYPDVNPNGLDERRRNNPITSTTDVVIVRTEVIVHATVGLRRSPRLASKRKGRDEASGRDEGGSKRVRGQ